MDFTELEAIEGLRWSWNAWPTTKQEATSLIIPLSIICTPLMQSPDLPVLPYPPVTCITCEAILNPYARVEYASRSWHCSFCDTKNVFPDSYWIADETTVRAELFPTHNSVEYLINKVDKKTGCSSPLACERGNEFYSSTASWSSMASLAPPRVLGDRKTSGRGPAYIFVIDACITEVELQAVKNELLLVLEQLPENASVGLVAFDSMVRVYDLAYSECLRAVVFHGARDVSSDETQKFLGMMMMTMHHGINHKQQPGKGEGIQNQRFLRPICECEFNIATAIEEIRCMAPVMHGHRPHRCTGTAISVALALIEGCSIKTGSRIMVFTSGPSTVGPGTIVDSDLSHPIRTHRDVANGNAGHYRESCSFYERLSKRLSDTSAVLDLFACSLDQIGAAELKLPVESSGGFMLIGELFDSDQFKKYLRHIFRRDDDGNLTMYFDARLEVATSRDVKICGALGPCVPLKKKNDLVSEHEIGHGRTCAWKLNTLTETTSIVFFFEVNSQVKPHSRSAFLVQFSTSYRRGNMEVRRRVTTAARRWAGKETEEIKAGFDQEAAAVVMARLAVFRSRTCYPRDVVRWLDDNLVRFASRFGEYIQEDPSSFRLPSAFSLFPQFMYYLRRSQFVDVCHNTPDETAFFCLMINREGVAGSLIMIYPTLRQYSFAGPPAPVLLDIRSVSPDAILLFDSYFRLVIQYGSKISLWRKLGHHHDRANENLRKLLEAPESDAEKLVAGRFPSPKLIKCDQHSSEARFLLAKLNPSVTQNSAVTDGSEIVFTDDSSLQDFMDHLQMLAVKR